MDGTIPEVVGGVNGMECVSRQQEETIRLARRSRVAKMYCLQRMKQKEIAERMGVSVDTVKGDLCWLRDRWLEGCRGEREVWVAEEIAVLDGVAREAARAWERSLRPREKVLEKRTSGRVSRHGTELPDLVRRDVKSEEGLGDPRYLEIVMRCHVRRCMLRGIEPTGVSGGAEGGSGVTVVAGLDVQIVVGNKRADGIVEAEAEVKAALGEVVTQKEGSE